VSLSGVVAIQLSTAQRTGQHGQKIDHAVVSFITQDGQVVASLDWGKFDDADLDQLSAVTGVRQDGGWFYKHSA
jgi:hypothetical protein